MGRRDVESMKESRLMFRTGYFIDEVQAATGKLPSERTLLHDAIEVRRSFETRLKAISVGRQLEQLTLTTLPHQKVSPCILTHKSLSQLFASLKGRGGVPILSNDNAKWRVHTGQSNEETFRYSRMLYSYLKIEPLASLSSQIAYQKRIEAFY